jgi:uncharacterized membrane-anchored protein YjiN (DUF445 family)
MSGLIEKIRAVATKKTETAHERYLHSLHSRDAERIAEAATAASVSEAKIEADLAVLERADALRPVVDKLAAVLKAKATAQKASDEAEREIQKAVERLQPAADKAADELFAVASEEKVCRAATDELDGLFHANPELLGSQPVPPAIRELRAKIAAQELAEKNHHALHNRVHDAEERVRLAKGKLYRLRNGDRFYGLKTALVPGLDEGGIELAEAEVAKEEKELAEAVVAAAKQD